MKEAKHVGLTVRITEVSVVHARNVFLIEKVIIFLGEELGE